MTTETRKCNSCAMTLPADATVCSDCGAKQHTEPDSLSSFALVGDDEPAAAPPPPAAPTEKPQSAEEPSSGFAIEAPEGFSDDELGDIVPDAAAEDAAPEEAGSDDIVLEDVSSEPPASPAPPAAAAKEPAAKPAQAEEDDGESPQTGETVRMSVHDVVQAWNEESVPEGAPEPETTTLGEASGLPKGFWAAVIACVLIVASLILLLS